MDQGRSLVPGRDEYLTIMQMAEQIRGTPFCPSHFQNAAEVAACMLKARELGIPPMYGLSHITPVQGRMVVAAEVMLALVYRTHGDDAIQWASTTATEACISYKRRGAAERSTYCFTMVDAERAGITNKQVWKQYPAAMLRARAVSSVCRMAFPDVIGGMYTPDELGLPVMVDDGGPMLAPPPAMTGGEGPSLAIDRETYNRLHDAEETREETPANEHHEEHKAQEAAQTEGAPRVPEQAASAPPSAQSTVVEHNGKDHARSTTGPSQKTPGPGAPLGEQISQKVLADKIREEQGLTLKGLSSWQFLARDFGLPVPDKAADMSIEWLSDLLTRIKQRKAAQLERDRKMTTA